ncbi:MAG: outer membrane protein transport protein [Pseudomonadales bacterium]|nr:outer membrane protein transport protein [Pseudomonadales bacterium]
MFSLRGLQKGIFVTKLIFSTLVASGIAHAAVLENLTIGNAKALALGNAVTADPPGIDSIHFNPAGLAHLKDRQYNLKLLAAQFTFGANFGGHDDITQQTLDAYELEDEVAYSKSETSTIGLRYPLSDGVSEWPLPFLVAPLGGASYNIPGSNITFATSVYTPLAAGYIRESDDPGRYMGDELSYMKVTYFSPSVGAKLSDEWSVGASLGFSWQAISAGTELRVPNIVLAVAGELQNQLEEQEACELIGIVLDVCGLNSDVPNISPYTNVARLEYDAEAALVWNFNIGALWKPMPWFTWGFVYQFESEAEMSGTYRFTYADEWSNTFKALSDDPLYRLVSGVLGGLPVGETLEEGKAKTTFTLPAHFATGISVQILPELKVNLDAKWTDWGIWDGITIEFDQDMDFGRIAQHLAPKYSSLRTLTIPRHYESSWNYAIGIEYQWTDQLALRFGYEPRKSSIPEDKRGVLLPLGDADLYGFGFEMKLPGKQVIDFGIGYLTAEADIPAGSSTNANSTDQANNFLYNP